MTIRPPPEIEQRLIGRPRSARWRPPAVAPHPEQASHIFDGAGQWSGEWRTRGWSIMARPTITTHPRRSFAPSYGGGKVRRQGGRRRPRPGGGRASGQVVEHDQSRRGSAPIPLAEPRGDGGTSRSSTVAASLASSARTFPSPLDDEVHLVAAGMASEVRGVALGPTGQTSGRKARPEIRKRPPSSVPSRGRTSGPHRRPTGRAWCGLMEPGSQSGDRRGGAWERPFNRTSWFAARQPRFGGDRGSEAR